MFWTHNIELLFQPVLIPTDYMTIDDKLNTLSRLIILICLIVSMILQDVKIILFMIILLLLIVIIYEYQNMNSINTDTFMNKKNITIIDNKTCTTPTKDNPFMNPILTDTVFNSQNNHDACPVFNEDIENKIDKIYDESMYRNADDIYDRSAGKRQFYTVPVNSIPNDQTTFANWLYNRGETCKENNGIKCYTNMYRDLRMS